METITLYSTLDLTTLERAYLGPEAMPNEELTGKNEYVLVCGDYVNAYRNWNRDKNPMLRVRDQLSHQDIYLGRSAAERVIRAIEKTEQMVQLL